MIFPSENQIFYFWACFFAGVFSSAFYALFSVPRYIFKNKIAAFLCDIGYFFCFTGVYVYASVRWKLPNIRPYMPLSAIIGAAVSIIILRNTLAKPAVMLYNLLVNRLRTFTEKINDRKKSEKVGVRGRSGGGDAAGVPARGDSVPDDLPSAGKEGTFRPEKNRKGIRTRHKRNAGRNRSVARRMEDRGSGQKIRLQKERRIT
ncbi:MAG: spore cortex biosynthesis protein YabQ [Clostridia bacterium]|nr:spore cortex biosynthesis protein YabQ [Clostridia bacterium]